MVPRNNKPIYFPSTVLYRYQRRRRLHTTTTVRGVSAEMFPLNVLMSINEIFLGLALTTSFGALNLPSNEALHILFHSYVGVEPFGTWRACVLRVFIPAVLKICNFSDNRFAFAFVCRWTG